MIFKTNTYCEN